MPPCICSVLNANHCFPASQTTTVPSFQDPLSIYKHYAYCRQDSILPIYLFKIFNIFCLLNTLGIKTKLFHINHEVCIAQLFPHLQSHLNEHLPCFLFPIRTLKVADLTHTTTPWPTAFEVVSSLPSLYSLLSSTFLALHFCLSINFSPGKSYPKSRTNHILPS